MYIDFDPKTLGEELKDKAFTKVGLSPSPQNMSLAQGGCYYDDQHGEDGGGGYTSDVRVEEGEVSTQAMGEEGGGGPL